MENYNPKETETNKKHKALNDFSLVSSFKIELGDFELLYLSTFYHADHLKDTIIELKDTSSKDIALVYDDCAIDEYAWFKAALEAEVDLLFLNRSTPEDIFDLLDKDLLRITQTLFVPLVNSAQQARELHHYWFSKYQIVPAAFLLERVGENVQYAMPSYDIHQQMLKLYDNKVVYHRNVNKTLPIITQEGVFNAKAM